MSTHSNTFIQLVHLTNHYCNTTIVDSAPLIRWFYNSINYSKVNKVLPLRNSGGLQSQHCLYEDSKSSYDIFYVA